MARRRTAISVFMVISGLVLAASCAQPTKVDSPEPASLDRTITFLIEAINEGSKIHVAMGDKLVKSSAIAARDDRCVLSIHDKQHTQLASSWQEADVRAILDLRQLSPKIAIKDFRGSGYHGATLTVSAIGGRASIPQDADFSSSAVGVVHATDPVKTLDLTIADHATGERIANAFGRAIDICRGQ